MRVKELAYRMKLRKILTQASMEELQITKEETRREIERRSNKKWIYIYKHGKQQWMQLLMQKH